METTAGTDAAVRVVVKGQKAVGMESVRRTEVRRSM